MRHADRHRRLAGIVLLGILIALAISLRGVSAQLDPTARDRVILAAVEIALIADVTINDRVEHDYLPIGSGTIVSPDGLVLTAWHVVDAERNRREADQVIAKAKSQGTDLVIALDPDRVLLLVSDGVAAPSPAYLARVIAHDATLDLAVLHIDGNDRGRPFASSTLPFVSLGDSAVVRLGDPLHVFGYPSIGDDALIYTAGVVSGFGHEPGIADPAWIMTDATISGGSSGGTAVNAAGELIGVPTQGTKLYCRPGDTNGDGRIDAEDVGCIPIGGSIGQLRPVNLAWPLLVQSGFVGRPHVAAPPRTPALDTVSFCVDGLPLVPGPDSCPLGSHTVTVTFAELEEAASRPYEGPPTRTPADCSNAPVYAIGTRVTVIAAEAPVWIDVPIQTGEIDRRPFGFLPAGTKLKIVGPYTENGACDLWPVLPLSTLPSDWPVGLWGTKPTDGATILIDEQDIRPI